MVRPSPPRPSPARRRRPCRRSRRHRAVGDRVAPASRPAMNRSCARTAATTSSGASMVSAIRSDTSSPASRRACCTTRTRSRAMPSAASSGVTVVSSTTSPELAGQLGRRAGVRGHEPRSYSPVEQLDARRDARVPSGVVVHSPAFTALITFCTSLPSRGPAARAFTDELEAAVRGHVGRSARPPSRSPRRAIRSTNGASALGVRRGDRSAASGSRTRSLFALRSASAAEHTWRTRSIASTSAASAGSSSTGGQSARCTERPPVSPRQIDLGGQRQQRRGHPADHLEHGVQRVDRVPVAGPEPVAASGARTSWSAPRGTRAPSRTRRRGRRRPAAPSTSRHQLVRLGQDVPVEHVRRVGAPTRPSTSSAFAYSARKYHAFHSGSTRLAHALADARAR